MVMVKMNFVQYGEMINLVATNKKLKERKLRIKNILNIGIKIIIFKFNVILH